MNYRKSYFIKWIAIALFSLSSLNCAHQTQNYLTAESRVIHESYWHADSLIYGYLMEGTKYQTPIFRFKSHVPGPHILILGGTHGNEPAGFEAAHRLLKFFSETPLKKGEIFIVPEANKIADYNNKRRIPVPKGFDMELGNLNRCYPGDPNGLPMQKEAYEITELIRQQKINLLLDLHESRFFHLESKRENGEYRGLGQTLIYTVNEDAVWLGMVAVDHLNSSISESMKRFTLVEQPIKHSAAWSAGANFNIPGFTVETCRKLPLDERVHYQMEVVKVMMKEMGVI